MNKIICLWSCPRNISTALMYSFSQREDTRVFDEPLYAHYLKVSNVNHPGKETILKALNNNDNPYKNFGIKQTWEFAHPNNREFTGPLENFTKMMFSPSYKNMINHTKHKINLIQMP